MSKAAQEIIIESTGLFLNDKSAVLETKDNGSKFWRIKGAKLDVLGVPTDNKTWYTKEMVPLEQAAAKAEAGELFLFVDHTMKGEPPENGNRLEKAGVRVEKLWWEESGEGRVDVYYDGVVIPAGKGEIIAGILETGGTVGYSKRGATQEWKPVRTKNFGEVYQPMPYKFMAWDIVTGQSVPEARTESTQTVFEQTMEDVPMTIEEIKKDAGLWAQITEAIRTELTPAFEQTVTDRIKAASDELKATLEAQFMPYKTASETLQTAMTGIVTALKGAGLIDDRPVTETEKALADKVTALEQQIKDKDAALAAAAEEVKKLKGPEKKPMEQKAVETFFMALPGGKAVMESFNGREFFAETEMQAAYDSMKSIARAVLETTGAGVEKPKGSTQENIGDPDEKEKAKAELKARAGL